MITRRFHSARRGARLVVGALLVGVALVLAIFFLLAMTGCVSTVDVRPPAPMYGPGGYAERMHVQRTPYAAPCRRR